MQTLPLGNTGLTVSALCLGTMTWGSHNTESEGHAQADMALDHGVTFWDTAEMYPTNPVRVETVGGTEAIIGTWLAKRGGRDRLQIATKVAGKGQIIRPGEGISAATLRTAVEASLRRLGTDYIDLYQLHWPNRDSYHFRQMWDFDPRHIDKDTETRHMIEVLTTAQTLIAEGKIRAIGHSNETVWGASRWLHLAETLGLPRMATAQNEYSLLCRQFDTDWAELSVVEDIPLLAFSPLAVGLLSGKYQGDVTPEKTRRFHTPNLGGRITPHVFEAVAAYLGVAQRHGLHPCQMAIAFTMTRPFRTFPIIGATTLEQLQTNIGAASVTLSAEVIADIAKTHRDYPAPY